jgi:DNA (cytosine-5)-methyltransferase 1
LSTSVYDYPRATDSLTAAALAGAGLLTDRAAQRLPFRRAADGVYEVTAVDLFCGAGGTSTGLVQAVEALQLLFKIEIRLRIVAVNHWPVAIETHSANHSFAQHHCSGLTGVDPRLVIPGPLDLLVASPECTHHSNARGGKPMDDQSRSSGDDVVRWITVKRPAMVLIENVREYRSWGPLVPRFTCRTCKWKGPETLAAGHGRRPKSKRPAARRPASAVSCASSDLVAVLDKNGLPEMVPDPLRKGEYFDRFLDQIRAQGYKLDNQLLCAADYGDPTTRIRLFVMCRRGTGGVSWPKPTHAKHPERSLVEGLKPWRAARELIDWNDRGMSIFNRDKHGKKPLKPNTMRRIAAGLRKFSGIDIEDYLVKLYGTSDASSARGPVPTVTGGGNHLYVVQPFVLGQQTPAAPRSTEEPAPTIAAAGAISKIEPYLVQYNGTADARKVEEPAGTMTSKPRFGLAQPFATAHFGERDGQEPRVHDLNHPAPTVTPRGMGDLAVPFLAEYHGTKGGEERVKSVDGPLPTQDTANRFGVAQPFIVTAAHGVKKADENIERRAKTVDGPLGAQTGSNEFGLAQPFVVPMNHDNAPKGVDEPVQAVTGQGNRFNLAQPFMLSAGGPEVAPRSTEDPAHTVLTRDHIGVATPFVVGAGGPSGQGKPQSAAEPLGTVIGENHRAIVEPFAVPVTHQPKAGEEPRVQDLNQPAPAVTGANRGELGLAQPEAFQIRTDCAGGKTAGVRGIDSPAATIVGAGGLGVVQPFAEALTADGATFAGRKVLDVQMVQYTHNVLEMEPQNCLLLTFEDGARWLLDIFFRMFRPRELARAQSFPDSYVFKGSTADIVKQIGNAVPVGLAQALCMEALLQMDWASA